MTLSSIKDYFIDYARDSRTSGGQQLEDAIAGMTDDIGDLHEKTCKDGTQCLYWPLDDKHVLAFFNRSETGAMTSPDNHVAYLYGQPDWDEADAEALVISHSKP